MTEKQLFERLDIRIGKVLDVQVHPDADSLYVEQIDLGEGEPRTIVSGLRKYMTTDELVGKYVVVLANLKPRKMRGIVSHGMVLCASNEDHSQVELLCCVNDDAIVPLSPVLGERVVVKGFEYTSPGVGPDAKLNPKKKYWEKCAVDLKTDDNRIATYQGQSLQTSVGNLVSKTLANCFVG